MNGRTRNLVAAVAGALSVVLAVLAVLVPASAVVARPPVLVAPNRLTEIAGSLDPDRCPRVQRLAVVDRQVQRAWLCEGMRVVREMPVTTAKDQPDPGWYRVFARDMKAWSSIDGVPVTMSHFVAFTRGKYEGARVAFHSVPVFGDGTWAQPAQSVGTLEHFGDSAGCIRVLPIDAQAIWDHLRLGGWVVIAS